MGLSAGILPSRLKLVAALVSLALILGLRSSAADFLLFVLDENVLNVPYLHEYGCETLIIVVSVFVPVHKQRAYFLLDFFCQLPVLQ